MSARVLILAIGRQLCDRKLLKAPNDVFYLDRDEIGSLVEASALETARAELIAARIEQRRAQHRRLLALPPPARLLAELPDGRLVPFEPEPAGDTLVGCAVWPGRVTGRARVVHELGEAGTLEPVKCSLPVRPTSDGLRCFVSRQRSSPKSERPRPMRQSWPANLDSLLS
jgi:hypothetical protein